MVYIIAAAMRDRKKRLGGGAEEPAGEAALPAVTPTPAPGEWCYACMAKLSGGETVCPACGKPLSLREKPGHLPAGTVLADRYVVGLAISESRSGIVYLAVDRFLETKHSLREYFPKDLAVRGADGADVAVTPGAQENFNAGKNKFVRELRLLSRMNGLSSAAQVTDLFYTNGTVYGVTDETAGQPLSAFLETQGQISPEYALALFAPVMRQLAREQSMGLLRCNLTPDSFTVRDGLLKLEGLGSQGGNVATFLSPGFAPEELYRKSGVPGAWTDVYSLCAVMYRCMTGVTPDAASDRVYKDELRAPSSLGVYLTAALEEGLMKGLSVYGEDRFPDCDALFRAIYNGRPAGNAEIFYRPIIDPLTEDVPPAGGLREPVDNDLN